MSSQASSDAPPPISAVFLVVLPQCWRCSSVDSSAQRPRKRKLPLNKEAGEKGSPRPVRMRTLSGFWRTHHGRRPPLGAMSLPSPPGVLDHRLRPPPRGSCSTGALGRYPSRRSFSRSVSCNSDHEALDRFPGDHETVVAFSLKPFQTRPRRQQINCPSAPGFNLVPSVSPTHASAT